MAKIFLGLCTTIGIVSGASSAQALSFNFSFSNVEGATSGTVSGTISGLSDGNNAGGAPVVVTVTSSPGSQGLGTYTFLNSSAVFPPFPFMVSGGNITRADWHGTLGAFDLYLGYGGSTWTPVFRDSGSYNVIDFSKSTMTFTPAAGVPFEFTPSLGFALVGLGLGASKLRQLSKKSKK